MSNFQRTRSKVWWGDSPPNIGSPLPKIANRNVRDKIIEHEEDWEPQLPHWIPPREMEESPPLPAINVWSPRQSPGSHKSQDSGFSDSDTSPSNNQQKQDNSKEEPKNKDCNLSAEKPKENNCCQNSNTPKTPKQGMSKFYLDTPKNLIKTPKDLHDYLQASCDIGHKTMSCSKIHAEEDIRSIKMLQSDVNKIVITPHKNVNNNNVVIEKCPAKQLNFNDCESYEESKPSNIQYIQISPSHQIAVNNQPRMRSPITRINCYSSEPNSNKNNDGFSLHLNGGNTHYFQRNGNNRSVNYAGRKFVEEDDEGSHSLGYIEYLRAEEEQHTPNQRLYYGRQDLRYDMTPKIITDTLNLKTPKKVSRTKQKKYTHKINLLKYFPKKVENFKTIHDITNAYNIDRVPSLGLPNFEHNNDEENDSFDRENSLNDSQDSIKSPKGILKTPGTARKITPPIQFRDSASKSPENEKQYQLDENFNIDPACTSTPKSLSYKKNSSLKTPHFRKPGLKPVNLIVNFNESTNNDGLDESTNVECIEYAVMKTGKNQPDCVKHWLNDIADGYEPECMTTLQSKALGTEVAAKIANSSATITGNIRKVQTHGQIIAHHFKQIIKNIDSFSTYSISEFKEEVETLVSNINEFILAHSITLKIKPPGETPERWDKIKTALQTNIQKAIDISEDVNIELNETCPEISVLKKHLAALLDIFIETARAVLIQQMKTLVLILEDPPSDLILKSTLTSLGHLGALMCPERDSDNISYETMEFITELPFVECEIPRALLSTIIESNKSSIKALCLRALSTICINSDAVKQFEEAGGIEIISDILQEHSNPEPQMKEAVTVLTQVTAPWLFGDYYITQLESYLDEIVKNITALLVKTSCCQLLLLCTACFVNVTTTMKQKYRINTIEADSKVVDVIEIFAQHHTVDTLLEAVKKRGPNASVFLQEQTATFINLISTSSKGRTMLSNCPAVAVALVCFLRIPRASLLRPANLQAEFRLVTQATEALSRLCLIPDIAAHFIQLEGVTRLITVIQGQKKQSGEGKISDQILVNCLRALRAIVKMNKESLKGIDIDITDMIKPNLMESVKIYSAKQESYV